MTEDHTPTDARAEKPQLPSYRPPGIMNALLLGASVLTILGIYGYSIYRTSIAGDELVLTPPRSAEAGTSPSTSADEGNLAQEPSEGDVATPPADPETPTTEPLANEDVAEEDAGPDAIAETPESGPVAGDDAQPEPPVEIAVVDEEEFLTSGWKIEATDVLRGFLAVSNPEEQIQFLNDAERIAPLLNAISLAENKPWTGLTVEDFKHVDLSDADSRKGIFLMLRETPGEDPSDAADRSYAFFKRSTDGLKLDLEVFLQTTGKAFRNFVEQPRPGTTRVFRVFITEDPTSTDQSEANFRTYIIAGLANFNSPARVRVTNTSPIGQILGAANFKSEDGSRQVMRNATVELRWTDHPENSVIELSRFICWEFLGLGGEPIHDPAAPEW